jgi:arsenate reductase
LSCFAGCKKQVHWPFDDPASFDGSDDEMLQAFRRVRDEIAESVRTYLATPAAEAGKT